MKLSSEELRELLSSEALSMTAEHWSLSYLESLQAHIPAPVNTSDILKTICHLPSPDDEVSSLNLSRTVGLDRQLICLV